MNLVIQPECTRWGERARRAPEGSLLGHDLADWRVKTRRELGLPVDRPVIATGHQTLLWHPGILVKYLLRDAVARTHGLGRANLVVDQHAHRHDGTPGGAGDFGSYDVPVRRADGTLAQRRIELTRPRDDVPMALHEAFTPAASPPGLVPALPSVGDGVTLIHAAIDAHRNAPDAARQMAAALGDLMRPWATPATDVMASELMDSSLSRRLVRKMIEDPGRCAEAYNAAVAAVPEAGIGPLLVRDDYVELPLWRIRDDGRRMHGYDGDAERWIESSGTEPRLMPRALFMTALVRLGLCDLFIHGLGGANYDRAMEHWIRAWLGVEPAAIAVATADLRLPLGVPEAERLDERQATAEARRVWHDPEPPAPDAESRSGGGPGPVKRELLSAITSAAYRSPGRRAAFEAMHRQLETLRSTHVGLVERLQRRASEARRQTQEAAIAERRDWPFPLYPPEDIDTLAAAVAESVTDASCRSGRSDRT